ncbi:MAG: S9 family peptidase [Thermoanaerobaculia bacterium]
MQRKISLLLIFLLLIATIAIAQPTPRDIAALASASTPQISPDGNSVVYTLTTRTFDSSAKPDDEASGGWTVARQIWVASPGAAPRQITQGDDKPSNPKWSPDGRLIAFLRKSTLNVISLDGGEARVVKSGAYEPQDFSWSPDGKAFAFTATLPLTDEEKKAKWESGRATAHGEEWRSSHIFVMPVEGSEPRKVTTWTEHINAFHWSPDGKAFVVNAAESADPYFAYSFQTPKVISAADGSLIRSLETEAKAIGTLRWSPDGRYIAYEKGEGTLSLLNHLVVHCVATDCGDAKPVEIANKLDPSLSRFAWAPDSKSILAHVLEKTTSVFYRLPRDGGKAERVKYGDRIVYSELTSDRAGRIAFLSSSSLDPSSPTIFDPKTGDVRVVVRTNPQVDQWKLGKTEVVRWKNPEGVEIEGLLTVAAGSTGPTPLVVFPHGGPDSVSSNGFSRWVQIFAGNGYSVLQPNYRGGFGYGFDFYAANRGRLGEVEFMDIESGVDSLIAAKRVDPDRLYYGGWSWGGYTTAYTIGHTNRYKAAVAGAAVVDTGLQYALSDINHGVAAQWEYKGNPWLQPENFARANPLHSLAKVNTPTLIIHGDADDRVPLPNGIILYRALKDIGTPVRLVTYPDEPHGFTNPAHTADFFREWLAWYAKYK